MRRTGLTVVGLRSNVSAVDPVCCGLDRYKIGNASGPSPELAQHERLLPGPLSPAYSGSIPHPPAQQWWGERGSCMAFLQNSHGAFVGTRICRDVHRVGITHAAYHLRSWYYHSKTDMPDFHQSKGPIGDSTCLANFPASRVLHVRYKRTCKRVPFP